MTEVALPLFRDGSHIPNQTDLMGRLMVQKGLIHGDDLDRILGLQKQKGIRFGEAAQSLGLVTAEDVKAVLAEQFAYPVVARPASEVSLHPRVIAAYQPTHPRVEALRSLRSELMLRYFNQPENKVLAVVGVDGESSIRDLATNLAVVIAQTGARTLLIDGNLRDPSLHESFGLPNLRGLSDALAGRSSAIPRHCPPLDSLWLLNGGTVAPNPQELLAHKRYQTLMAQLVPKFDAVLINTPALDGNLDAQLVAARSGAALMVARENHTPLKALDKATHRLRELGVAITGVALSH